ncbi:MAG TPA: hydroxyacid dehydrogenase [Acidimicrobiales bacterium]|jgi:phosphoglycerate dehydrogenase-like enzyme|nr:hydroxyacid dehydrogenase [Acidimicrobiales bacterium]
MNPALIRSAFTEPQWTRLHDLAEVVDDEPLATFTDERATAVLRRVEVLLGHWGCPTLDAQALEKAPELRLLAYAAGSVKEWSTITDDVFDRKVLVTSAAAANAVPVAEFTVAAIVFANKGVFLAREWLRDPDGPKARRPKPVGNYGKRVGIVGASHVGRKTIELLRPFDLDVVVADPYLDERAASEIGVRKVELDELVATSDVVSIHAPDLPETRHLVGAAQLAAMKDGAVLINTARGALVDTEALEAELATGRISAVLDVTDPEPLPRTSRLYDLPNVFLTPHVAGSQGSELARLADLALDEIERYVRGEPPLHPITREALARIA